MGEGLPDFASAIDFAEGDFVDLGLHKTQVGVLPLVHVRRGVIRPLGTCFSITNDGLCVTARHVIEEAVTLTSEPFVELDEDDQGSFGALYVSEPTERHKPNELFGGLLPMFRVHMIGLLDIALIKLTLPVRVDTGLPIPFPAHRLRLSLPGVGEPFFGLGYRTMDWRCDAARSMRDVHQTYSATRGQVEELHASGRDRSMLPYPTFRTSARLDGGMSGGPLFDHFGRVFGVVCSSFGPMSDGTGHVSYGSLIGPAVGMTLDVTDERDGQERKAFLWDMIERGAVSADTRGVVVESSVDNLKLTFGQSIKMNAKLGG